LHDARQSSLERSLVIERPLADADDPDRAQQVAAALGIALSAAVAEISDQVVRKLPAPAPAPAPAARPASAERIRLRYVYSQTPATTQLATSCGDQLKNERSVRRVRTPGADPS